MAPGVLDGDACVVLLGNTIRSDFRRSQRLLLKSIPDLMRLGGGARLEMSCCLRFCVVRIICSGGGMVFSFCFLSLH
jgi:hypothetical protein